MRNWTRTTIRLSALSIFALWCYGGTAIAEDISTNVTLYSTVPKTDTATPQTPPRAKGPMETALDASASSFGKTHSFTVEHVGMPRGGQEALTLSTFYAAALPTMALVTALGYSTSARDPVKEAIRFPELPACRGADQNSRGPIVEQFQALTTGTEILGLVDLGPVIFAAEKQPSSLADFKDREYVVFGNDTFAGPAVQSLGLSIARGDFTNMDTILTATKKAFGAFYPWSLVEEFNLNKQVGTRPSVASVWGYHSHVTNAVGVIVANQAMRDEIKNGTIKSQDVADFLIELRKQLVSASWAAYARVPTTKVTLPADVTTAIEAWQTKWVKDWKNGNACQTCTNKAQWEATYTKYCTTKLP